MASPRSSKSPICRLSVTDDNKSRQHTCPFCGRAFSRVDAVKRHAKQCPRKGDRTLTEARRGRRLRACDACSRAKVRCNSKSPCCRCSSRGINCTYKWLYDDPSHQSEFNHSSIPFLLKVTDPGLDSRTKVLISKEPKQDLRESLAWTNRWSTQTPMPSDLFFGYTNPGENGPLDNVDMNYDEDIFGLIGLDIQDDSMTARLNQLMVDVHQMLSLAPNLQSRFDGFCGAQLFTTSCLLEYLKTFYRLRHYQFALIHWATFDPEKVSTQLLLAAMLTGASYSRHDGNSMNEGHDITVLYEIAEKYIFKGLKSKFYSTSVETSSNEQLQLLQAALLILGLQYDINDSTATERIATKRLPVLVKALRKMDLVGMKHSCLAQSPEWETFIYRESCIRIVMWTWNMDALAVLIYNNPPLMTLAELSGQLPCVEELWDAASREEFDTLKGNGTLTSDFHCLKTLIAGLLSEDWTNSTKSNYEALTVQHLHGIVIGLQPVLYNIHTGMLPKSYTSAILRALDRWDSLWNRAMCRFPIEKLQWLGVCKNSHELSSLTRRIIEVAGIVKENEPKYLQRTPATDTAVLHQFIYEYCSGA